MKDGPHPTLAGKGILGTTTACEASPTLELVSFTPQANPLTRALFSSQKILQNFSDSPSHRIFRCMHGVLNIYKNKN